MPGNSGELWLDELLDLFSCENWLLSSVLWVLGDTSRLQDRTTHDNTVSSIRPHTGQTIDELFQNKFLWSGSDPASWTLQVTELTNERSGAACQDTPPCLPHIRFAAAIYFTCQWHNPNKLAVSISWNHRGVPRNVSRPLCETGAGAHLTQTPVASWKHPIQVTWAVLLRPMSLFRGICVSIKLRAELNPFYSHMQR